MMKHGKAMAFGKAMALMGLMLAVAGLLGAYATAGFRLREVLGTTPLATAAPDPLARAQRERMERLVAEAAARAAAKAAKAVAEERTAPAAEPVARN